MHVEKADKNAIKKRKFSARELVFLYLKVYAETGNCYWLSSDNANRFKVASGHINMSNLCCEILLSTKPLKLLRSDTQTDLNSKNVIEKRDYDGEIGICNLTNINLVAWDSLSEEDKNKLAYSILVGMDNAIENGSYPVKAGEKFNRLHRALGIGITNYQNWLALQGIKLSDEEALEKTHEIMESISFYLTKNSIELAKERGRYHYFEGSLWSKGKFQHELYKEHFDNVAPELNFNYKYDWDSLREDMMKYGVRFENLMATAPGACQVKENKILTDKGSESIREIMERSGINYQPIEQAEGIGWYKFKEPVVVKTRFGEKKSNRIFYNGKKPVYQIEFEDGNTYKFTGNHTLLIKRDGEEMWVRVDELQENDDVVSIG
jgi:ribonucleotide reductase alpha subunit